MDVPLGACTEDLKVMLDLVLAGIVPVMLIVTVPLANIFIDETEKLDPLEGQLPLDPEQVHLIEVFFEDERPTEAPLTR